VLLLNKRLKIRLKKKTSLAIGSCYVAQAGLKLVDSK
jgi:hypothetical protein